MRRVIILGGSDAVDGYRLVRTLRWRLVPCGACGILPSHGGYHGDDGGGDGGGCFGDDPVMTGYERHAAAASQQRALTCGLWNSH